MLRRLFLAIVLLGAGRLPAQPAAQAEQASDSKVTRARVRSEADGSDGTNDAESIVEGRVLVEAADGGILLEDRAGRIWNLTPADLISREQTEQPFEPFDHAALANELRGELGQPFRFVRTRHFLIATSGNPPHAEWCGALLERLMGAFVRYWRAAGMDINPSTAPLSVVVHGSRDAYAESARKDGGVSLIAAGGYYSLRTNRVVLLDPTAAHGLAVRSPADVQRFYQRDPLPASTIAHEATHQLAFNCGLLQRYADNPVWLTEGMAMYFEIPDLGGGRGWRTIGRINGPRMQTFRRYASASRTGESLTTLIAADGRFRDVEEAEAAYAESWVLTYFLLKTRRREYVSFLEHCSEKPQCVWETRNERLQNFTRIFGIAPAELDDEFLRFARKIR